MQTTMLKYDPETIMNLVKLADDRKSEETVGFLLDFLETLVAPSEFERFLEEIGKA